MHGIVLTSVIYMYDDHLFARSSRRSSRLGFVIVSRRLLLAFTVTVAVAVCWSFIISVSLITPVSAIPARVEAVSVPSVVPPVSLFSLPPPTIPIVSPPLIVPFPVAPSSVISFVVSPVLLLPFQTREVLRSGHARRGA